MTLTSDPPSLYEARKPVFPKAVKGRYRRLKWAIMGATLAVYYLTPWIRFDRGPFLPDQAVLMDLANRRFYFFWIEIWPDEFHYIAGLLIMAGIGLFLFTSTLGRIWCGYACPQTVWVDLFQHIERWIDGDRNAQFRLLRAPWSGRKLGRRSAKWAMWLGVALATGGAWIFYFADAPSLAADLINGRAHPVAYASVGILTATTFVLGGFLREQVCIYMCPWPRIQAAMMDERSLTVTYKDWRGEPRGKHRKRRGAETLGDCIDCDACVAVCPTGVDIRRGQQIGCVTCALCIDACDEVMGKIGKPRGLIDYCALTDEAAERAGAAPRPLLHQVIRPRTLIYFTLWAGVGLAMVAALFMRDTLGVTVRHERNPVYVTLSDGAIRNAYEVRLQNRRGDRQLFRISAGAEIYHRIAVQGEDPAAIAVAPDATRLVRVFLTAPGGAAGRTPVRLWVENLMTRERAAYDTHFQGPDQ